MKIIWNALHEVGRLVYSEHVAEVATAIFSELSLTSTLRDEKLHTLTSAWACLASKIILVSNQVKD